MREIREYYQTSSKPGKPPFRVVVADNGVIKAEWTEFENPIRIVELGAGYPNRIPVELSEDEILYIVRVMDEMRRLIEREILPNRDSIVGRVLAEVSPPTSPKSIAAKLRTAQMEAYRQHITQSPTLPGKAT